jgi:CBS domain-containing protein
MLQLIQAPGFYDTLAARTRLLCDGLQSVADGAGVPFDGELDDYARWLTRRGNDAAKEGKPAKDEARLSPKEQRKASALVSTAAKALRDSDAVMVVEEGKPVGVLTRHDLLGYLSDTH